MTTTIYALGSDFGSSLPGSPVFIYSADVTNPTDVATDTAYNLNTLTWTKLLNVTNVDSDYTYSLISGTGEQLWETVIHNSRYVTFLVGGNSLTNDIPNRERFLIYDINTNSIVFSFDDSTRTVLAALSTVNGLRIFVRDKAPANDNIDVYDETGSIVDTIVTTLTLDGLLWYDGLNCTYWANSFGTDIDFYEYVDGSSAFTFFGNMNPAPTTSTLTPPSAGDNGFFCNNNATQGVITGNSETSRNWTVYDYLDPTITTAAELIDPNNWTFDETFPGTETWIPTVLAKNLGYAGGSTNFVMARNEQAGDISGVITKGDILGTSQVMTTVSAKPTNENWSYVGAVRARGDTLIAIRANLGNTSQSAELVQVSINGFRVESDQSNFNDSFYPARPGGFDIDIQDSAVTINVIATLGFTSADAIAHRPFNLDLVRDAGSASGYFNGDFHLTYYSVGDSIALRKRGRFYQYIELDGFTANFTVKSSSALQDSDVTGWLTTMVTIEESISSNLGINSSDIYICQISDTDPAATYDARIIRGGTVIAALDTTLGIDATFYPALFDTMGFNNINTLRKVVIFTRFENSFAKQLEWFYWAYSPNTFAGVGGIRSYTFDDATVANISSDYHNYGDYAYNNWLIIGGNSTFLSATKFYLWRPGARITVDITDATNYGTIQYPGLYRLFHSIRDSFTGFHCPVRSMIKTAYVPDNSGAAEHYWEEPGGIISQADNGNNTVTFYKPISKMLSEFNFLAGGDADAGSNPFYQIWFCVTLGDPSLNYPLFLTYQPHQLTAPSGFTDYDDNSVPFDFVGRNYTILGQARNSTIADINVDDRTGAFDRSINNKEWAMFVNKPTVGQTLVTVRKTGDEFSKWAFGHNFDVAGTLVGSLNADGTLDLDVSVSGNDRMLGADALYYYIYNSGTGFLQRITWAGVVMTTSNTAFDTNHQTAQFTWLANSNLFTRIHFCRFTYTSSGDTVTDRSQWDIDFGNNFTVLTTGVIVSAADVSVWYSAFIPTPNINAAYFYQAQTGSSDSNTGGAVDNLFRSYDVNANSFSAFKDPLTDRNNFGGVIGYPNLASSALVSRVSGRGWSRDEESPIMNPDDVFIHGKLARVAGASPNTQNHHARTKMYYTDNSGSDGVISIAGYTLLDFFVRDYTIYGIFSNRPEGVGIIAGTHRTFIAIADRLAAGTSMDIQAMTWYRWGEDLMRPLQVPTTISELNDITNYRFDLPYVTWSRTYENGGSHIQHTVKFGIIVPEIVYAIEEDTDIEPDLGSATSGHLLVPIHDKDRLLYMDKQTTDYDNRGVAARNSTVPPFINYLSPSTTLTGTQATFWNNSSTLPLVVPELFSANNTWFTDVQIIDNVPGSPVFDTIELTAHDFNETTLGTTLNTTVSSSLNTPTDDPVVLFSYVNGQASNTDDPRLVLTVLNTVTLDAELWTWTRLSGLVNPLNQLAPTTDYRFMTYYQNKYIAGNSTSTLINGINVVERPYVTGKMLAGPGTAISYPLVVTENAGTYTMRAST